MMLLAVLGILTGALIGARLTVFALIPAMACALIIGGAATIAGGSAFGPTIAELALLFISMQIGYLGGAALRFCVPLYRGKREKIERPPLQPAVPKAHTLWRAKPAGE
jgi:hypothetical protein